jgi:tripartite-type tricarboxylate transporter receptor subunit TctC
MMRRFAVAPRLARLSLIAAIALLLVSGAVRAAVAGDGYPSRPIRLLVGFGAGGPTDIPARFIADRLGSALGQPVVVENRPGAGGVVATRDVIAQPADGYTLLLCTHFEAINIAVYRNAGFKLSDLAPVSLIAKYYYALALSNAVPATDFKTFIAYAKAHPGEVTYATVGTGSAQEVIARQLEQLTGVTMNRIPFRGGIQVVQELIAGRIGFFVSPSITILPQYQNKQLKILALTSPERVKSLPEIPALKEFGINFDRFGWLGLCAATGTPEPIIKTLHDRITPIVASADYRALVDTAGTIAVSSTAAELGAIMNKTLDDTAASVKEFGMQQDQ